MKYHPLTEMIAKVPCIKVNGVDKSRPKDEADYIIRSYLKEKADMIKDKNTQMIAHMEVLKCLDVYDE